MSILLFCTRFLAPWLPSTSASSVTAALRHWLRQTGLACLEHLSYRKVEEVVGYVKLSKLFGLFTGNVGHEMRTPTRSNTLTRLPWLAAKRLSPPIEPLVLQPIPHIEEEFRQYIRNEVPARLIDTSTLTFVERDALFHIFFPEIAQVTEEDVQRRIRDSMQTFGMYTDPEAGIYVKPRKEALRNIIRDIVRYAIFSHRWSCCEPSYQDVSAMMSSGLSTGRRNLKDTGIAKLLQLCETAGSLGYKLVWSDTCCIDKANKSELSEAVHAMFKWYAHAHVCIIHLATSSSLAHFECEPWFKRGWTLQELLAPRRVKFYSKDWHPFTNLPNDKDHLALVSVLSTVTGIPREVVVADNTHGIRGHCIWEIMSWASTRKTTRIEDVAYCLFGIFDVNLPVTYGEGEKAFPRLLEAIMARHPTWDVFAWEGQASRRNPALPCSPAGYPRWDEAMVSDGVGMTSFTMTSHGLRLASVPLIPLVFVSAAEEEDGNGSYRVTLRPRPEGMTALGTYSDITVICGSGRLQQIRDTTDLHACILNYKPSEQSEQRNQGTIQVGRTYICFLLHVERLGAEGSTWLKFTTDNILRITCTGGPAGKANTVRSCKIDGTAFQLSLGTTYIRTPRASTLHVS